MGTNVLKGTLFGGFKRRDVISYIEKSSREHNELIAVKDDELAALRKENEELRGLPQRLEELDALREENERLTEELSELRAEAEHLRGEAEEFRALKDHLTELQMEAVRCAKEIETNARERAERTESVAYARIRAVSRESKTRFDESFAFVDDLLNATKKESTDPVE